MIFSLLLIIVGLTFFAMAASETRNANGRQNSSKAFYMADGAIERTRAKFLEDRSWRSGWTGVATPDGTYDLTVRDTTFTGYSSVVRLVATGHVENTNRRIEVFADVPPTAPGLSILIMGDADIGGNLCVAGSVHLNPPNEPDDASHVTCGAVVTTEFTIIPPPIFTDPVHFPGATYYYVKGNKIGPTWQAKIYDRDGNDITAGNTMIVPPNSVLTYNPGANTFTFSFDSAAKIAYYFDEATDVFKKNAGDTSVVVNFGEEPVVDPPGVLGVSKLSFDAANSTIRATVINARYVGPLSPDSLRTVAGNWRGAVVEVKKIIFEPRNGIAMIAYDMEKQGSSHVQLGTTAYPALVYITNEVVGINANFELVGSIICLGDFHSTGGPDITYHAGFIPVLPTYLSTSWPTGVSGTLKILRWRELAAGN
jgi:hypothetical protein